MLKRFQNWLSRRNPFWFALAYVCVLLIWALLYLIMPPGSFYAPYARYEREGADDEYDISKILQAAVRNKMYERSKEDAPTAQTTQWSWESSSAYVSHFTAVDSRTLAFDLTVMLRHGGDGMCQLAYSGRSTTASFSVINKTVSGKTGLDHAEWKIDLTPDFTNLPRDNCLINPAPPPDKALADLSTLKVSMGDLDRITIYVSGLAGDPLAISGSLWRKIYFSSVVITTVGFGDIVPMTTLTRTLVASEAVLGLMMFGLFLNAVAAQAGNHNRGC